MLCCEGKGKGNEVEVTCNKNDQEIDQFVFSEEKRAKSNWYGS